MTRKRYPDTGNAGRSKIVPYIPGERPASRHKRRLETNIAIALDLAKWTAEKGVTLRICNAGHHWIFERPGLFAEWWPSSAKLVFEHRYQHGIHAHDHAQVMREIGKRI